MRRRRGVDPAARQVAIGLGAARVAIGLGALLATGRALRLLGFAASGGATKAVTRLGGSRDVALGAFALLAVGDRRALRAISFANACVDAADAMTFGLALAGRDGIDRAALLGAPSAAAASATGFWLAQRLA